MRRLILCLIVCCSMCLWGCSSDQEVMVSSEPDAAVFSSADEKNDDTVQTVERQEVTEPLSGIKICVDPGHEVTDQQVMEPIAPNSDAMKAAFVGGASGGSQSEEALNLSVGLKLSELLKAQGATVVMTRTTHESNMTSYQRAQFANEEQVDLCIRIHADGSNDPSVHGMSMQVPYGPQLLSQEIVAPSRRAGEIVLNATIASTGAQNNGIVERTDLTGFNFVTVPTILIEMGFMSNPEEDALMATEDYQNLLAEGMCKGIVSYFER